MRDLNAGLDSYDSLFFSEIETKGVGLHPPDHPETKLTLQSSYEQWANALGLTDGANYIRAGLGYLDTYSLATKTIVDGKTEYVPYHYQGAGTPFLIGTIARVFGENHVLPYFIAMEVLHLLTALAVVWLASSMVCSTWILLVAGLASLYFPPVLLTHFGAGLFLSEPPSMVLLSLALTILPNRFLPETRSVAKESLRSMFFRGIAFGAIIGLASYFRSIWGLFGIFTSLCGIVGSGKNLKGAICFLLTAATVISLVQLPWQLRNQHVFKEFCMQGSQYRNSSLLYAHWQDWRAMERAMPSCCLGLGDYLRPDLSEKIRKVIWYEKDKDGCRVAAETLMNEAVKQPLKAISFRFRRYDFLWIDSGFNWFVTAYSVFSLTCFLVLFIRVRGRLPVALWSFPVFMLLLSPFIGYEPRFLYPFYLIISPVCIALLIANLAGQHKSAAHAQDAPFKH